LGHGTQTAKAIGQRDDRYTLEDMTEADEGYFTIGASAKDHATQKMDRGSKTKANVKIMVESIVLEDTIKTDKLRATMSRSGNIFYKVNSGKLDIKTSGSGAISKG